MVDSPARLSESTSMLSVDSVPSTLRRQAFRVHRQHPGARAAIIGAALSLAASCATVGGEGTRADALVVFLVRHAEKVDGSRDAALTEAGQARAQTLAHVLRSADLTSIYSSDFVRTRATAAPVAACTGLGVQIYDPRDLPGLIARLRRSGGRHLVVGHSNTTPNVVGLLGGDPGPPIDETSEYDRLYVVTVGAGGSASTALIRFGAPYTPVDAANTPDP